MPFFRVEQVLQAAATAADVSQFQLTEQRANATLNLMAEQVEVPDPTPTPVQVFDIFLSHSSLDAIKVLGIYYILTKRKYSVYLDRICDPHLNRATVNRSTATIIRRRMTQCKSLFVATTSNTTRSKWVPWELGFTDGFSGKAAILPILPAGQTSFGGLTYFELYPTVQDNSTTVKPNDLEIWDGATRVGTWGYWLKIPKSY